MVGKRGTLQRSRLMSLTPLPKVCSPTPRLRAAAALIWPDSTSRTASCLNSSVYRPRFDLVIVAVLSHWNSSLWDMFCAGRVIPCQCGTAACKAYQGKDRRFIILLPYYIGGRLASVAIHSLAVSALSGQFMRFMISVQCSMAPGKQQRLK